MKTLTLKATIAMTAPVAGTPILPQFDPSLMASYDRSSVVVAADGTTVTQWKNKQGIWGAKGDLTPGKPAFPTSLGTRGVVFPGGGSESWMDSSALDTPMPVGKATYLVRMKFGVDADSLNCTIFASNDSTRYVFLRRAANGSFEGGAFTPATFTTTQTLAKEVWADLAFVIDGANSKVYINDSATIVNPFGSGGESTLPNLRLGANIAGVNRLNGEISHFRLYNRALSLTELKEIRATM